MLKIEINILKNLKQTPKWRLIQNITKTTTINLPNTEAPSIKNTIGSFCKSYAKITTSSSAKTSTVKTWTKVRNSKKRKDNIPNLPTIKPKKRRVIFCYLTLVLQKLEADLIFSFNKSLQKARVPGYIRLC